MILKVDKHCLRGKHNRGKSDTHSSEKEKPPHFPLAPPAACPAGGHLPEGVGFLWGSPDLGSGQTPHFKEGTFDQMRGEAYDSDKYLGEAQL